MRLVFTSGTGVAGAVIRWWTWGSCGHVAVETDATPLGVPHAYLDATSSAGVSEHADLPGVIVARFDVRCSPEIAAAALAWARSQIGKPYDWSAIYGIPFRRDWRDPSAYDCAELVAAAFEAANFPLIRLDHLDRITPRDLMLSEYLIPA